MLHDLHKISFHSFVIPNWKRSASDWGSSPAWIPACAGMTHPLSSPTESKALRIGDLEIIDWIPALRRSLSRAKPRDSEHACAGMTEGKMLRKSW